MIPIACTPTIDRAHRAVILSTPRGPALATEAMGMERWHPKREVTRQEQFILKRLEKKRKLFGFLRRHRHEIFDDKFQAELESMYRDTGAGSEPVPPAQLAMALLLQGYLGLSDADAVDATVLDLRWQLVLGCIGMSDPPFSQRALQGFRERLIAHDMDRRLLERTVELAKSTREFDWKKLPKTLRVAIDSAPLEGAGRVEDTLNLLAHAARKVVECAAGLLHWTPERVCREARAPLLLAPSIKAALDRDWSDPAQKAAAVKSLVIELENLKDWLAAHLAEELKKPPLSEEVGTLKQLMDQDLEPDPEGGRRAWAVRRCDTPPFLSSPRVINTRRVVGTDSLTSVPIVTAALASIRAETEGFVPISEGVSRFNTSPGGRPFDLYDRQKDLGNLGRPTALTSGDAATSSSPAEPTTRRSVPSSACRRWSSSPSARTNRTSPDGSSPRSSRRRRFR